MAIVRFHLAGLCALALASAGCARPAPASSPGATAAALRAVVPAEARADPMRIERHAPFLRTAFDASATRKGPVVDLTKPDLLADPEPGQAGATATGGGSNRRGDHGRSDRERRNKFLHEILPDLFKGVVGSG